MKDYSRAKKSVTCFLLLKDKRIASGSNDGKIRIYDPINDYQSTQVLSRQCNRNNINL